MEIIDRLLALQDVKYGDFQAKLIPGLERSKIIGVRTPAMRKLAKELLQEGPQEAFLQALPHKYYDENILHGLILSEQKDYELCLKYLERFLPFVDNWAVCDLMSPKSFKKHRPELLEQIKLWIASPHLYTSRFGMEMLMSHFLDQDFKPEYLELPARVVTEEYYLMMMQAWFYATALAKQWEATIPYLEQQRFSVWVHNKTIQKAIESYRITAEQKQYLRTLKRK